MRRINRPLQLLAGCLVAPGLLMAQATSSKGPAPGMPPGHQSLEYRFADAAAGSALFVVVLVLMVLGFAALRERRRHRLLATFVEHGREIPPALLPPVPSRQRELRRGTWLTGFAIGIGVVLYVVSGDARAAIWGVIPLCLGAASFVNAALFYPDHRQP